jgi:excisionase family DNA binding protein
MPAPVRNKKSGPNDEILARALEVADAHRRGDHARVRRLLFALPAPGIPPPTLVSVQSLRQSHSLTGKKVYRLLADHEIDSVLMGKRRLIVLSSVDAYVARLLDAPEEYRPSPNPLASRRKRTRRQARA